MNGRVAELAVRYRVPRGASIAAAQVPLLDRAMQMGLADEVAAQIGAIDDAGGEVIVLREATARVTLRPGDWSLDRAMLERLGRAARESVVARLARPAGEDDMVRFASEAEFVGSFILDLLDGSAWDRWYYGAFRRFRLGGPRETLERLLADGELDRGAVFAWLEARGKLAEVLRLVGPTAAGVVFSGHDARGPTPAAELRPLAAAALALLEALGMPVDPSREAALLAEYWSVHPDRPAWDDRARLTEWVWAFARWLLVRLAGGAAAPRPTEADRRALHTLLAERLDWLDGEVIEHRVAAEWPEAPIGGTISERTGGAPAISPSHGKLLRSLAALVRRGSARFDRLREAREQLVIRMIAALEAAGEIDGARDRAFAALLERACDTWQGGSAPGPVLAAEPAMAELLEALAASSRSASGGIETRGAGLYLLTRAVSDVNLVRLAERAHVPRAALLGALAGKLLGLRQPFDAAVAAWVGAENPALDELEVDPLRRLQDLLLERLLGQGHLGYGEQAAHQFDWRNQRFAGLSDASGRCWPLAWPRAGDSPDASIALWSSGNETPPAEAAAADGPVRDLEQLARLDEVPPAVEVTLTAVVSGVLRAWSRWLPGISGASMPFLVRTCLARAGCVRLDAGLVEVTLDPAPLDAVLELAGYLKPMESAAWLGRRVRFSIARSRG